MSVLVFLLRYCTCAVFCISGSTCVMSFAFTRSASASAIVNFARSVLDARPREKICPGEIEIRVVPSADIRAFTASWAPFPIATIAMTAPTPITTPSIVSTERILLARSAVIAIDRVSPTGIILDVLLLRLHQRPVGSYCFHLAMHHQPSTLRARWTCRVTPGELWWREARP